MFLAQNMYVKCSTKHMAQNIARLAVTIRTDLFKIKINLMRSADRLELLIFACRRNHRKKKIEYSKYRIN